jgi:hypothetical protein
MTRSPKPEIPVGSIVIVSINNYIPTEPPSFLGPTHASRQKQIAFNKSVLKKEEEVVAMNSDISIFLNGLRMDEAIVVCAPAERHATDMWPDHRPKT